MSCPWDARAVDALREGARDGYDDHAHDFRRGPQLHRSDKRTHVRGPVGPRDVAIQSRHHTHREVMPVVSLSSSSKQDGEKSEKCQQPAEQRKKAHIETPTQSSLFFDYDFSHPRQ